MECIKRSFILLCILFALALSVSIGRLDARENDFIVAAAQSAKQQCVNLCRARYRDCRHLNQLSSFECRGVYQDCTRYSCTGLGPG